MMALIASSNVNGCKLTGFAFGIKMPSATSLDIVVGEDGGEGRYPQGVRCRVRGGLARLNHGSPHPVIMFNPVKFLDFEAKHRGLKLYCRFGHLPPRGLSFNPLELCFEAGISFFDVALISPDEVEIDLAPINLISDARYRKVALGEFLSRGSFLVTGPDCERRGGDEEPCLKWAELLAPLTPIVDKWLTVPIVAKHPHYRGLPTVKVPVAASRFKVGGDLVAGFYPEETQHGR